MALKFIRHVQQRQSALRMKVALMAVDCINYSLYGSVLL